MTPPLIDPNQHRINMQIEELSPGQYKLTFAHPALVAAVGIDFDGLVSLRRILTTVIESHIRSPLP